MRGTAAQDLHGMNEGPTNAPTRAMSKRVSGLETPSNYHKYNEDENVNIFE